MQNYDPMADFWKQAISFLMKQAPPVAISFLFLFITVSAAQLMWGKMERMQVDFENKIERNNQEWKLALDTARQDWRDCEAKREELAVKVAALKIEVAQIKSTKKR